MDTAVGTTGSMECHFFTGHARQLLFDALLDGRTVLLSLPPLVSATVIGQEKTDNSGIGHGKSEAKREK
jgi:hypothetical protein